MVSPNSHMSLELKIIEAINVEPKSKGNIFVRYYVNGGEKDKRKVGLKTKEISINGNHVWNESFSLECSFTTAGHTRTDMITKLKQLESFVFELRWRKKRSTLFRSSFWGSKLLGRAEILWKEVIDESPNMVLEKWVNIGRTSGRYISGAVPSLAKLKVEIRVRVSTEDHNEEEVIVEKSSRAKMGMKKKKWDDCGCKSGHYRCSCTCEDYHVFALATTFEAF
ncbi:uncharacterized protein LOC115702016 [Cannabis sativa]|uniref:uncharacterized protein LOC115702016 n=1 Tax=Cannabis sativa TaxID=3483 RepID=UPI0029CA2F53|nr:uncharacterized protein LOC115702016 [Cannabis sativa]